MVEHAPYSLLAELEKVKGKGRPPIHLWHPDNVKDIDMVIQQDGTWMYMGSPITRQRLVHLFSTVLLKEAGEYFLVTPVEKCRITVEDSPFQAVLLENSGQEKEQILTFTTDMAEEVTVDESHALRFEINPDSGEPAPYVMVRDGLEAKLTRSVYYQTADLVVSERIDGVDWLGIWSSGIFFKIQPDET
jgi:hypothetical protein